MEKKTTIFNYLAQVFMIYGITTLLLNIFCVLFGAEAEGYSAIFSLENRGVGVETSLQFLLTAALVILLKVLFTTELLIKKMNSTLRIILMFASCLGMVCINIALFEWFPTDDLTAWVLFLVCFAVSCTISTVVSVLVQRAENEKLSSALERYKQGLPTREEEVKGSIKIVLIVLAAGFLLIILFNLFMKSRPDYDRIYADIGVKKGENYNTQLVIGEHEKWSEEDIRAAFEEVKRNNICYSDGHFYVLEMVYNETFSGNDSIVFKCKVYYGQNWNNFNYEIKDRYHIEMKKYKNAGKWELYQYGRFKGDDRYGEKYNYRKNIKSYFLE